MVDLQREGNYSLTDLLEIMRLLRSPEGCPWDREQTHDSIRANCLEEAYELSEAIVLGDYALMREELGDLLLQVVFHSQMACEAGLFDLEDVIGGICEKLVERHPHIFGGVRVSGTQEVLSNWESIKSASKGHSAKSDALKAVSGALPALMRAEKLISRAEKAGYPFKNGACGGEDSLGDSLFGLCLRARRQGLDPELALLDRCGEFIREFERWETEKPG